MEPTEFYNGLKSDEETNSEFVAGAEHFVRLKKQVGLQPSQEDPIEKEAEYGDSWGDHAGGQSDWKRTFYDKRPQIQMPQIKQSSLKGALQKLGFDVKSVAKNPQVLGAVIGAGLGAGSSFLNNRAQDRFGGRSKTEFETGNRILSRADQPETGFLEKIRNRREESAHGIAKAFREHPVKGSLVGAGIGAISGASLARALGALGGKKR